jgi:hypothetical protein
LFGLLKSRPPSEIGMQISDSNLRRSVPSPGPVARRGFTTISTSLADRRELLPGVSFGRQRENFLIRETLRIAHSILPVLPALAEFTGNHNGKVVITIHP